MLPPSHSRCWPALRTTHLSTLPPALTVPSFGPFAPPDTVLQATQTFEAFLDLTLAAFLVITTLISHNMIKEKMAAKKEAAAKGAAKRAGDGSGPAAATAAAPAAAEREDSPDRVVTAKASMRARRRMA
jgi:hypothetical protein